MSVISSITTDSEDIDTWLHRYRNKSEKQIEDKVQQVGKILLNADHAEVAKKWSKCFQGDKRAYKNPKNFEDFVQSVKVRFGLLANKVRTGTTTESDELEIDSLRLILVNIPQASREPDQDEKHDEASQLPSKSNKDTPCMIKEELPVAKPNKTQYQRRPANQDVKHQALLYFAQKDADNLYHNPDLPRELLPDANARFHMMSVDNMLARESDSDSDNDNGNTAQANEITEHFLRLGLKDINRSARAYLRERR